MYGILEKNRDIKVKRIGIELPYNRLKVQMKNCWAWRGSSVCLIPCLNII